MNLIKLQNLYHRIYKLRIPLLPKIIYVIQFFLFDKCLLASVKIGKGSKFTFLGIRSMIHGRFIIGDNLIIGKGITIRGRTKKSDLTIIGHNYYLGAVFRILGFVKIGDNVIIGPNAVVLNDIPSNSIAVGIPAKVIKTDIDPNNFI